MRPCLVCGTPSPRSRCDDHQPRDTRNHRERSHVAAANLAAWKNLSRRVRKASPFCEQCGAREALTVDHVIPVSVCPDLAHAEENLRVLCRTCNSSRGNTFAEVDAREVLDRLHAAYRRHPTRAGRERIAAAETAATRGDTPPPAPLRRAGEARRAMKTIPGCVG